MAHPVGFEPTRSFLHWISGIKGDNNSIPVQRLTGLGYRCFKTDPKFKSYISNHRANH